MNKEVSLGYEGGISIKILKNITNQSFKYKKINLKLCKNKDRVKRSFLLDLKFS